MFLITFIDIGHDMRILLIVLGCSNTIPLTVTTLYRTGIFIEVGPPFLVILHGVSLVLHCVTISYYCND